MIYLFQQNFLTRIRVSLPIVVTFFLAIVNIFYFCVIALSHWLLTWVGFSWCSNIRSRNPVLWRHFRWFSFEGFRRKFEMRVVRWSPTYLEDRRGNLASHCRRPCCVTTCEDSAQFWKNKKLILECRAILVLNKFQDCNNLGRGY